MITRFGLVPRRAGMTIDDFQRHWRDVHGPLVATLRGLRRNWQSHAVLSQGEPLLPWIGFDAVSEMDFDDVAAMESAFSAEHYPPELKKDSAHLVDMTKSGPMVTKRQHLGGSIDLRQVRLMTFIRRAPRKRPAELHEALRSLPLPSPATARELYLSIADNEGIESSFDAIDVQWFATPQLAQQFVTSSAAREQREEIAHLVRGVERLIARVHVNFRAA
jgi:uncharacterized protein (TIGR02118 family)